MNLKKIISVGMIVLLLSATTIHPTYATEGNKGDTQATTEIGAAGLRGKSEVVYARLSAAGEVNALYVVNHYKVEKGGAITDFGDYSSVKNLSSSEEILVNQDEIRLQSGEGDFYYQGNLNSKELPWRLSITYTLDSKVISPGELSGKSGELEIRIRSERNNGLDPVFYENYVQQISVSLPSDKCNNIEAPDATIAEAGNNRMLVFTVLPGKDADFTAAAKVTDFEMNGIEISAMPFSMNLALPDTDSMLKDLEELPKAVADLNDGVGALAEGTTELKKGADKLKNGSGEFKLGLEELTRNSTGITGASTQIEEALSIISESLKGGMSGTDLGSITQLPAALSELSKGLDGISKGLSQLKEGYKSAYSALDAAILDIPDTAITMDQINQKFPEADKEQRALLSQLYSSYVAGQTVKGTYAHGKQVLASVVPTLDNVIANIDKISAGLTQMSGKIESSLSDTDITAQFTMLSEVLSELSKNYTQFDAGLKEYMKGISELSTGYQQFDSGLKEFVGGVADMNNGVSSLYEGTKTMNKETSNLPEQMQKEIDSLTKDYTGSDFAAVSFVSPKNTNIELVQFVLKGEDIKKPEVNNSSASTSEGKNDSVWDRFLALFIKEEK